MRWTGHIARMGAREDACRDLVGDLREREHLQNLGVDVRIIFDLLID